MRDSLPNYDSILKKKSAKPAAYQPLRTTPGRNEERFNRSSRRTVSSPDLRKELDFRSAAADERRCKHEVSDLNLIQDVQKLKKPRASQACEPLRNIDQNCMDNFLTSHLRFKVDPRKLNAYLSSQRSDNNRPSTAKPRKASKSKAKRLMI